MITVETISKNILYEYLLENPYIFKYIPKFLLTNFLCLAAVTNYGNNIKYVPKKYLSYKWIIYAAIADDPKSIRYIDTHYLDYNAYKLAINLDPATITNIMDNGYYSEEIYLDAINQNPNYIKVIPTYHLSNKIILLALSKDGMLIEDLLTRSALNITYEMCTTAMNQSAEVYKLYGRYIDRIKENLKPNYRIKFNTISLQYAEANDPILEEGKIYAIYDKESECRFVGLKFGKDETFINTLYINRNINSIPGMREYIKSYQKMHHLDADGILGHKTLNNMIISNSIYSNNELSFSMSNSGEFGYI